MDYFIGLSILYNISLISVVRVITGFVRTVEQCYAVSVITTRSGAYLILGTNKKPVLSLIAE